MPSWVNSLFFFSSFLTALCPWWRQVNLWAQCEQTNLWGFDNRPASDHFHHPGVPVAACLWVCARRKQTDFLTRCQGQEHCHRALQHSHTWSNQVFFSQCYSHAASYPPTWHLFVSSHNFLPLLVHSSSLGSELVNLWFPQQRVLCKE